MATPAYQPEELLAEERRLVIDRFDYDVLWWLGNRIRASASERKLPVAIHITHGLDNAFQTILPGATADNLDWTRRKINAAYRYQHSSLYLRLCAERDRYDFNTRFRRPVADYAASGGGLPLIVRHAGIVGAVAVSGLPDVEDHRLVVEAIDALIADHRK
jgi:uncharacterized protein (UPF0303 family)